MSTARSLELVSVGDYLQDEMESVIKHEYVAGVVHAMAGAKNRHNIIATNVLGTLFSQLVGKPCRPFNSDTKVHIHMKSGQRFYYPDASIVCEENPDTDSFQDKPVVIVEVLSESTRRIDEEEKREAYCTLPSLKHYVLVEQDSVNAVEYRRLGEDEWERVVHAGAATDIRFPSIDANLNLNAVYDGIRF